MASGSRINESERFACAFGTLNAIRRAPGIDLVHLFAASFHLPGVVEIKTPATMVPCQEMREAFGLHAISKNSRDKVLSI